MVALKGVTRLTALIVMIHQLQLVQNVTITYLTIYINIKTILGN